MTKKAPPLAAQIAERALKKLQGQVKNPESRWKEMGGELLKAIQEGDADALGKLLCDQVGIAMEERSGGQ